MLAFNQFIVKMTTKADFKLCLAFNQFIVEMITKAMIYYSLL